MTTTELVPQDKGKDKLAQTDKGRSPKQPNVVSPTRLSGDFYGAVGWLLGLLITLFISTPIIWFLTTNASRSNRAEVLALGIAVAWWLNPLSLGGLGYVLSNIRNWRLWTILGLFVWATVNILVSLAFVSDSARTTIVSGLIVVFYILLALLFLYIQLRVFIWAAGGKPARFFFGIIGWGALNGLIYWALISPEVLNVVILV